MQGEVILSSCPWSSFFVLVLSQQQSPLWNSLSPIFRQKTMVEGSSLRRPVCCFTCGQRDRRTDYLGLMIWKPNKPKLPQSKLWKTPNVHWIFVSGSNNERFSRETFYKQFSFLFICSLENESWCKWLQRALVEIKAGRRWAIGRDDIKILGELNNLHGLALRDRDKVCGGAEDTSCTQPIARVSSRDSSGT